MPEQQRGESVKLLALVFVGASPTSCIKITFIYKQTTILTYIQMEEQPMSVFINTKNPKHQGSIGESRAVYEYTRMGMIVSKPIMDCDYDLLVDDGTVIRKVQVKTTKQLHYTSKNPICNLRVMGGNQSFTTTKKRKIDDWDILFVLAEDGRCWSIPSTEFKTETALTLTKKCDKFII
jgi:hypothetical protein